MKSKALFDGRPNELAREIDLKLFELIFIDPAQIRQANNNKQINTTGLLWYDSRLRNGRVMRSYRIEGRARR